MSKRSPELHYSYTTLIALPPKPTRFGGSFFYLQDHVEFINAHFIGEDISMTFWPYGDPAPEILRTYVGDSYKIRLINGGIKKICVIHFHYASGVLYTLDTRYGVGSFL